MNEVCQKNEFFAAALPWIVMGLTVAVFVVNEVVSRKGQKKYARMVQGLCVGICCGTALHLMQFCSLENGLAAGAFVGIVCGKVIKAD